MTRDEILTEIKNFAKENGYKVSEYADKIAEAKRRMGTDWSDCCCHREGDHFCGSPLCKKEIEENGKCCCGLFIKR